MFDASELCSKTEIPEEGIPLLRFRDEAPISEPHDEVQYRWGGRERLDGLQVRRNRLLGNLAVELVAERGHVFKFCTGSRFVRIAMAPDLRFPQEVEARALDDMSSAVHLVSSKEDRRPEDLLERGDESAVLLAAFQRVSISAALRKRTI